jgi:hypothetical protein
MNLSLSQFDGYIFYETYLFFILFPFYIVFIVTCYDAIRCPVNYDILILVMILLLLLKFLVVEGIAFYWAS